MGCNSASHSVPREVLGLVDLVALENGELGPLLSASTLRTLEDECVTDVKVRDPGELLICGWEVL